MSDADRMQAALEAAGLYGEVVAAEPLSGGAIQENWMLTLADGSKLVLRSDAASAVATSHGRGTEFRLLAAAHAAGVAVPEPLALVDEGGPLGRAYFVMRAVPGVALGQKVVRDPGLAAARAGLAERIADEFARIHAMEVPRGLASELGPVPEDPAQERLGVYRRHLDALERPSPVIELALRWLAERAPEPGRVGLVHRDFRTGNYLVDENGFRAVLDWEFAGWGDPSEDLAWFCSADWRFGREDLEAGGIGSREDFLAAYEKAAGWRPDDAAFRFWLVMAHVRWAIIALEQGERFTKGGERTLELALIGRRVHVMERNMLTLIGEEL